MDPALVLTGPVRITAHEFAVFANLLRVTTGIELKPGKEQLVVGRLDRRLRHLGLDTFTEYYEVLTSLDGRRELQVAIDLLTTNETYFFREPQHFDMLPALVDALPASRPVRVWSAASSTGEEACSIAMTLHDLVGPNRYQVVATDVSSRVVATARRGLYPVAAAERIPLALLKEYCLKGTGEHEGTLAISPVVRRHITFTVANLTRQLPDLGGDFDIVFLRNVLIYFAPETKVAVVSRILQTMPPGGTLLIGHAESLSGIKIPGLVHVAPSVYRRAER